VAKGLPVNRSSAKRLPILVVAATAGAAGGNEDKIARFAGGDGGPDVRGAGSDELLVRPRDRIPAPGFGGSHYRLECRFFSSRWTGAIAIP